MRREYSSVIFTTPEEIEAYFATPKIQCLECGKRYKSLGVHLLTMHEMSTDDYRAAHGIPWTYGLVCPSTRDKYSAAVLRSIASGVLVLDQANARAHRTGARKPRQPIQDELSARSLARMNAGKTGEATAYRASRPKRGSPEHKAGESERAKIKPQVEIIKNWWRGKQQPAAHKALRFARHSIRSAQILECVRLYGPITADDLWRNLGGPISIELLRQLVTQGAVQVVTRMRDNPDVSKQIDRPARHYYVHPKQR